MQSKQLGSGMLYSKLSSTLNQGIKASSIFSASKSGGVVDSAMLEREKMTLEKIKLKQVIYKTKKVHYPLYSKKN